ncbi:octaprenyl diphosphate synthase [Kaarinaea lacus]
MLHTAEQRPQQGQNSSQAHNLVTEPGVPAIETVNSLVAADMEAVNQLIQRRLHSDVALVNQVSSYIINSGGKRLRPVLVLLSARAFGYTGHQHYNLAAIVEFIHTATLLHDDVVDASDRRRGKGTANALWGNEAAVLVGDFLYSRAFQMMVDAGRMRIMEILADATNTIAEGEVMQLLNCHDPETTEQRYLDVIHCKTAKLFEAAAQLGAVLCDATPEQEQAMAKFGMHLGTAFQLVDDVLDYSASADEMGKNVGDDLAEGKPTLPLIRAMHQGTAEQADIIRNAIETGGLSNIKAVTRVIEATDAIAYTAAKAREEADQAIDYLRVIPPSIYTDALKTLADFSVSRTF